MNSNAPEKSVWVDIPGHCRIQGEFTGDLDVLVMFGEPKDGVNVLFERGGLERFMRLVNELLTLPLSDDPNADLPKIIAPAC
jgi:hypothetical protein